MERTEYQKTQVREEFARRRKRQLYATIPVVALMLGYLFLGERAEGTAYPIIFFVAIGLIVIFSFRNWRCPACEGYLGRTISPKFCSKCGAQLC